MSFFNFRLRKRNVVRANGVIGGACGPTSIFIAQPKTEQEDFLSYAAERITPCERPFKELEEYLIEKYEAVPYTLPYYKLNSLKVNVILNYFDHLLDKPAPLPKYPTQEEVKAYFEQDTSVVQAQGYSAEELGLEMKAYKLPGIRSKKQQENESSYKHQLANKNINSSEDDVIVEMEMKSGYLCICNGGNELMDDLILYLGVSEKDIKERSPRFISYAYSLRNIGKL